MRYFDLILYSIRLKFKYEGERASDNNGNSYMVPTCCPECFPGIFYFYPHKMTASHFFSFQTFYPSLYSPHFITLNSGGLLHGVEEIEAVEWIFLFSNPQSTIFSPKINTIFPLSQRVNFPYASYLYPSCYVNS